MCVCIFIGHTDSDKLGPGAVAKYGDNYGLSKARAEIAAIFFQRELDLPPDAVSYDGAGDSKPIAGNNTPEGKARNRRVEVQVWYDEINETAVEKEVLVEARKLNRVKVCRKETVCKLQYKELGDARGIRRYGFFVLPMAESRVDVALDVSNRPYLVYRVEIANDRIRDFDASLVEDFLYAFSQNAGLDMHVELRYGKSPHHVVEAIFKGLARALRQALDIDPRQTGLPTVKGAL